MLEFSSASDGAEPNVQSHGWDQAAGDVHPSVTLHHVCARPRPRGHVIVFANEKGGVGKSTLAFHCSIALAHAGHSVLTVDLDRRQQSLDTVLANRDATVRSLQAKLPQPRHIVLERQSGSLLSQEIARHGNDCDIIVIDVAGHDSAIARYAIAMADTLVTPLNSSAADIDLLGKFDPVTKRYRKPGHFAELVNALRDERRRRGMPGLDWMVVKNRVRTAERRQQMWIDDALGQLAPEIGFRVGAGLRERVAYRELFPFGLTHLDLKHIPGLAKIRAATGKEIVQLVEDLELPELAETSAKPRQALPKARVSQRSARAYGESLQTHLRPHSAAFAKSG